jgi:hypothetical protein
MGEMVDGTRMETTPLRDESGSQLYFDLDTRVSGGE